MTEKPVSKTIILQYPIEIGDRTLTEITYTRPKAKRGALMARISALSPKEGEPEPSEEIQFETTKLLIRALSGLSADEVDEVDLIVDLHVLGEAAAAFLEEIAPDTSKTQDDGAK